MHTESSLKLLRLDCAVEDGNGKSTLQLKMPSDSSRLPSIFWQFVWNFFFGPYLLWKIHVIHDIYHWRLQTMLAIIAG